MPRCLTAQISRFQRTRVMRTTFVRGDVLSLSVNLNGALDADAEIASVEWQVSNPNAAILGTASKTAKTAAVEVTAGCGSSWVKATVVADDGAVFTQLFELGAAGAPWFQGESGPTAGPYSASA